MAKRTSALAPNPKNPRKITDKKLEMLKKALHEFGDLSGIVFNRRSGQLVGGHQRLKTLDDDSEITIERKYKKPTRTGTVAEGYVLIDGERFTYREVDWSEHREKAANLAANKGAGEWDTEQVEKWLGELAEFDVDIDLDLTMFDEDERKEFAGIEVSAHTRTSSTGVDEDNVPEKVEPRTRLGDVYRLGDHRLMCGDSTDLKSVERLMKGEKAEMLFTDPPYGVNYEGGHFHSGDVNIKRKREKLVNDGDASIYPRVMPVVAEVVDGPCYTWFAFTRCAPTIQAIQAIQAIGEMHALIIWHKTNATYAAMNAHYKQRHEPCVYWKPKGSTLRWCGPTDERTVWEMKRDGRNEYHPTQKPVELAERAISNHEAKTVLDLFGGSGSTLIACEKTGRKCYMMELDPGYVDVIVERWEKYTGRKAKLVASAKDGKPILKKKPSEQELSRNVQA